jgi:hypothetical protein
MIDSSEGDTDTESEQQTSASEYQPSEGEMSDQNQLEVISRPTSPSENGDEPPTQRRALGMRKPLMYLEEMARFTRYWADKNQLVGLDKRDATDCEIRKGFRIIRHIALIKELRPYVFILYKMMDRWFYGTKRNRRASQTPNLCQRYLSQFFKDWPEYKHQGEYKLVKMTDEEVANTPWEEITLLVEKNADGRLKLISDQHKLVAEEEATIDLAQCQSRVLIPEIAPTPLDPLIQATANTLINQLFGNAVNLDEGAEGANGANGDESDDELQQELQRLGAANPAFQIWSSPRRPRIPPPEVLNNAQLVEQGLSQLTFKANIADNDIFLPQLNSKFQPALGQADRMFIVSEEQISRWIKQEKKLAAMGCAFLQPL